MELHVREFVEDEAHPESMRFDDGNLQVTAVELVLPSEPVLASCSSITPAPSDHLARRNEEIRTEEGEEDEVTTEMGGKRKPRVRRKLYSSVVDSPSFALGDRSSRIVLAHDIGRLILSPGPTLAPLLLSSPPSLSYAPCKRTKRASSISW